MTTKVNPKLASKFGTIPLADSNQISESYANGSRYYRVANGNVYLSVTSLLKQFKSEYLKKWCEVPKNQASMAQSSSIGTDVHAIIESRLLDKMGLPSSTPPTSLLAIDMANRMDPVLDDIQPYALETALWSDFLRLAGRTDCVGLFEGVPSIIDFKTSKSDKPEKWIQDYFIQATCYALMWEERTGVEIPQIVILITTQDGQLQVFKRFTAKFIEPLHEMLQEAERRNLWNFTIPSPAI